MKQLLAGVALLAVIGIASFLYRNTVERPGVTAPIAACTMEARVCPDGTTVGRAGPACEFAPCALPNIAIEEAGIAFVLPEGYSRGASDPADATLLATLVKPASLDWPPHAIEVRRHFIPEGMTAEAVILANTRYQPADEQAIDFSRFEDLSAGGRTYRATVVERFEGLVESSFFLARGEEVLSFSVSEKGVQGWTEPSFDAREQPEHQALIGMLETLQAAP